VKFETQPRIIANDIRFNLRMVSPDLTEEMSPSEAFEKINSVVKAFGFKNILGLEDEVVFWGEKADLHIVCRSEKVVKQTDDGYFIVYQPKFALELRYK
jgi:hypothetical protein